MNIYIPTYKRLDRQPTLHALAAAGVPTTLVVRHEEYQQALDLAQKVSKTTGAAVFVAPITSPVNGIHETRQWIVDNAAGDKVIMMDDDLDFACRGYRKDNPLYLSRATPEDLYKAVYWMYDQLNDFALAGLGAREGNNRKPTSTDKCSRMMRAWGLRKDVFCNHGIRFDRVNGIEDFDVILQFLENGYENIISNVYVTNQAGSNTAGGCSTFRTLEYQKQQAELLQSLHPQFVKTVQKETKTAWGGAIRTDVNVQWKKAFNSYKGTPR